MEIGRIRDSVKGVAQQVRARTICSYCWHSWNGEGTASMGEWKKLKCPCCGHKAGVQVGVRRAVAS